jgi:hypothetical protein
MRCILRDFFLRPLAHAAEKAGRAPQPGADEIEHRDRKTAVDIGGLRQIGDIPDVESTALDEARQRPQDADDAAKQRRLAGAVRTDDRDQRAGRDLAVQMMHRRMAVIAQRDVAELQLNRHRSPHRQPYDGPQAGADRCRRAQPRQYRHAQDRPRRDLRRMRRRRSVAVVIVAMGLGCHDWKRYIIT